jgi:predicted exporter
MKRALALLWLAVLLVAALYLGARLYAGLTWRTDLLALLPRDAQDAGRQQAEDAVTRALSQRLVLLLGNREETVAHTAALTIQNGLAASGIARVETTVPGADAVQRLGALYAPFHRGLLSATDRATLLRGEGQTVAEHALAQV